MKWNRSKLRAARPAAKRPQKPNGNHGWLGW
jgi:hypothetical protein